MTEKEAKSKWCPFALTVYNDDLGPVAINRDWPYEEKQPSILAECACIGSRCMAWRESKDNGKPYAGRCGLAAA